MIRFVLRCWLGLALAGGVPELGAAPRLDVFPGYSSAGYARLGSHYPIALELQGDGPTVKGYLEISSGKFGGNPLRVPMELPSGTTKRIVLPAFASSPNINALDVLLVQDSGKTVVERRGAPLVTLAPEAVLVGVLPGQAQSAPVFPESPGNRANSDLKPLMLRLEPGFFPDQSLGLEGLNALYLNSRRALELKEPQYVALQTWVAQGGHVVVAVENPTDVTATGWLRELLPAKVGGVLTAPVAGVFYRYLAGSAGPGRAGLQYGTQPVGLHRRSAAAGAESPFADLVTDTDFERQSVSAVGLVPVPEAEAFLAAGKIPLAVSARYGRGLVTVLAFNPEQEPFRSWKHRGWFFARLLSVPAELLNNERLNLWGGRGIDTVFGAMIETRQIRKLPVGVLLVLLLVYLGVIGPFDQWWLKKINRPMLTWITFPSYVALFSLLIYFIGFKLRSGQSEYSELQVVDVLPRGASGEAVLRGRSFASIYSPANNTYKLRSQLPTGTLRGEFRSGYGVNNDAGRLDVTLDPQGFHAGAYVPVWTAQGYVGDWVSDTDAPLAAQWAGGRLSIKSGGRKFAHVVVVLSGKLYRLGPLGGGGEIHLVPDAANGEPLTQLVANWEPRFGSVAQKRESTFGDSSKEHIDAPEWLDATMAASFCGQLSHNDADNQRDWMWPNGFDLTPSESRGDTLVFAWMEGDTVVPRMNQFTALRGSKSTLLRLVVPRSAETP